LAANRIDWLKISDSIQPLFNGTREPVETAKPIDFLLSANARILQ
jgi:hypothetical protein